MSRLTPLLALLLLTPHSFAEEKFDPETAIFIGSSTMGHWKPRMEKDFKGIPTWNFGENGTDYHYLHETVPGWAKKFPAKRWVIYSGDNDLFADPPRSPEKIASDMAKTVALIREHNPEAEVFVLSIKKRVTEEGKAVASRVVATNQAMAAKTAEMKKVTFVDTYSAMEKAMREKGKRPEDFFQEDGVHLNDLGYDIWRDTLRPLLEKSFVKKKPSNQSESEEEHPSISAN